MLKAEDTSGAAWAPSLCDSCRSAPCTVYCRADAAALCAACDANIHSANLLARRHHRVPILPALAGGGAAGLVVRPSLNNLPYHIGVPAEGERGGVVGEGEEEDREEDGDEGAAASWMLLNPLKGNSIQSCHSLLFGDEGDEFLDLEDYNNNNNNGNDNNNNSSDNQSAADSDGRENQDAQRSHGGGSDVGSEFLVPNEQHSQQQQQQQQGYHHMMEQFEGAHGFGYSSSLQHSASFSSMDVSLVPDATCMADMSRPSKGTIDLFSGHPFLQVPAQFNPMDREARVLRYREKRKNRKFEKTIRYASRKAYAETRPRIKGRFAKRSDLEVEVDQMFSTSVLADSSYGIVPSF